MKILYNILNSYISEDQKKYFESANLGWTINTSDCLEVTFEDGTSSIYPIFEGPWTRKDMCRDCGLYYEIATGNHIYRFPQTKAFRER